MNEVCLVAEATSRRHLGAPGVRCSVEQPQSRVHTNDASRGLRAKAHALAKFTLEVTPRDAHPSRHLFDGHIAAQAHDCRPGAFDEA